MEGVRCCSNHTRNFDVANALGKSTGARAAIVSHWRNARPSYSDWAVETWFEYVPIATLSFALIHTCIAEYFETASGNIAEVIQDGAVFWKELGSWLDDSWHLPNLARTYIFTKLNHFQNIRKPLKNKIIFEMDKSNHEANGATNIRTLWWKQANIIKWKQAYSFYFIKIIKIVLKISIIDIPTDSHLSKFYLKNGTVKKLKILERHVKHVSNSLVECVETQKCVWYRSGLFIRALRRDWPTRDVVWNTIQHRATATASGREVPRNRNVGCITVCSNWIYGHLAKSRDIINVTTFLVISGGTATPLLNIFFFLFLRTLSIISNFNLSSNSIIFLLFVVIFVAKSIALFHQFVCVFYVFSCYLHVTF